MTKQIYYVEDVDDSSVEFEKSVGTLKHANKFKNKLENQNLNKAYIVKTTMR